MDNNVCAQQLPAQLPTPSSRGGKGSLGSMSCTNCKKKKTKCTLTDGDYKKPCHSCIDGSLRCIFDPTTDKRTKEGIRKDNEILRTTASTVIDILSQICAATGYSVHHYLCDSGHLLTAAAQHNLTPLNELREHYRFSFSPVPTQASQGHTNAAFAVGDGSHIGPSMIPPNQVQFNNDHGGNHQQQYPSPPYEHRPKRPRYEQRRVSDPNTLQHQYYNQGQSGTHARNQPSDTDKRRTLSDPTLKQSHRYPDRAHSHDHGKRMSSQQAPMPILNDLKGFAKVFTGSDMQAQQHPFNPTQSAVKQSFVSKDMGAQQHHYNEASPQNGLSALEQSSLGNNIQAQNHQYDSTQKVVEQSFVGNNMPTQQHQHDPTPPAIEQALNPMQALLAAPFDFEFDWSCGMFGVVPTVIIDEIDANERQKKS